MYAEEFTEAPGFVLGSRNGKLGCCMNDRNKIVLLEEIEYVIEERKQFAALGPHLIIEFKP